MRQQQNSLLSVRMHVTVCDHVMNAHSMNSAGTGWDRRQLQRDAALSRGSVTMMRRLRLEPAGFMRLCGDVITTADGAPDKHSMYQSAAASCLTCPENHSHDAGKRCRTDQACMDVAIADVKCSQLLPGARATGLHPK